MKIYTFGRTESECYGHGDFARETVIKRTGGQGTGDFPPCFKTREKAVEHLASNPAQWAREIVELNLVD